MLTETARGTEILIDGAFEDAAEAMHAMGVYLQRYPAGTYDTALSLGGVEGATFIKGVRRASPGPSFGDWCASPQIARDLEQRELRALRG